MPSTYTTNLGLEKPADGEQSGTWGQTVNVTSNILDRAINGSLSLSLSGTASTLTTSDGTLSDGQYKLLVLGGTPSGTHTITLSPNDAQKIYFVRNTTAQSVVFTQGSGGNVTLATGDSGIIYSNGGGSGAAIVNLTDDFAMSSVKITGGSITGITDLAVADGGTGASTAAAALVNLGLTATAAELNFVAGVTSAIQTQLNAKAPLASPTFTGVVSLDDGSAAAPSLTNTGDTNTGLFFPAADTMAGATGGVERWRGDGNGNFGVAAIPTNNTLGKTLQVGQAGALVAETGSNRWWLGSNWFYNSGDKYINDGFATLYSQQNGTHQWLTAASGTAGNAITFTQAMTLDADGKLLFNTTSDPENFKVNFWFSGAANNGMLLRNTASAGGPLNFWIADVAQTLNNTAASARYSDSTTIRWELRKNGGLANFGANNVNLSDERVKTDIVPLAPYWEKIKAIQVVTYKYLDQTHGDDNIGVIAQQVESVAPEFVSNDGFGETPADGAPLKSIYETDLHYATLKALQEAMARIETLEARVAALEA